MKRNCQSTTAVTQVVSAERPVRTGGIHVASTGSTNSIRLNKSQSV